MGESGIFTDIVFYLTKGEEEEEEEEGKDKRDTSSDSEEAVCVMKERDGAEKCSKKCGDHNRRGSEGTLIVKRDNGYYITVFAHRIILRRYYFFRALLDSGKFFRESGGRDEE